MTDIQKLEALEGLAKTDYLMLSRLIELNKAHTQLYNDCAAMLNIINQQTERILILEGAVRQMFVPSPS